MCNWEKLNAPVCLKIAPSLVCLESPLFKHWNLNVHIASELEAEHQRISTLSLVHWNSLSYPQGLFIRLHTPLFHKIQRTSLEEVMTSTPSVPPQVTPTHPSPMSTQTHTPWSIISLGVLSEQSIWILARHRTVPLFPRWEETDFVLWVQSAGNSTMLMRIFLLPPQLSFSYIQIEVSLSIS